MHALPAITEAKDQINNITFDWVVDKNFSSVPKWHPNIENTIETNHREWKLNLFSSKSRDEMRDVVNKIDTNKYDLIIDMQNKLHTRFCTTSIRKAPYLLVIYLLKSSSKFLSSPPPHQYPQGGEKRERKN